MSTSDDNKLIEDFGAIIGLDNIKMPESGILQLVFDGTDSFYIEKHGLSIFLYFSIEVKDYELYSQYLRALEIMKPYSRFDLLPRIGFGDGKLYFGFGVDPDELTVKALCNRFERLWEFRLKINDVEE